MQYIPEKYNLYTLHEYQQIQNNAVRQAAREGKKRIISCISTGSGKSLQLAELTVSAIEKMKRVVIVLPRRSLVKQLSESFFKWGINHGVVMAGCKRFTQPRVQIVSIDTYLARMSAGRMAYLEADVLIIDEMHLQFTKKKLEVFSKYPVVIGFSATPIAPKKQSLGIFYDAIVETISMTDLMAQGYLTPLKYYADPNIDLSDVGTDADGDWRESQLGDVMDKPKLVGDILKNWIRIAENKPTVIFASSQAHARHLCEEFCSHGYRFEYVDCNTIDDDREALFDRVRSGKTMGIVNVGIISVGIDITNIECVVLARPTKLVHVYLQCVGRTTRIFQGKEYGIIIDHAGIIERLGLPTQDWEWSLDGSESVEERAKKKKAEKKEPKEIICKKCNYVFISNRRCPKCGYEMVQKTEKVPTHEADLVEIKSKKEKYTPEDKERWYAEFLGYARRNGKADSMALALFQSKFKAWPHKKRGVVPSKELSPEVQSFITANNIRYHKGKAKAAA
jgi:superfamily II DNA or RNA helicase